MSSLGPSSSAPPPPPQHSLLPCVRPLLEKNCRVAVWRLPIDISQSRLCGRVSPSNACTLIALQSIELLERRDLHFAAPLHAPPPATPLATAATQPQPRCLRAPAGAETRLQGTASSRYLVGTFIEAMVEGNEAHERATKTRRAEDQNFTIPDAIAALSKRHTEIDFCSVTGSFTQHLPRFIRIAMRSPSLLPLIRLHFVIIAFERTVLLVADRRTSTLILLDSHLHGSSCGAATTGAIVAAAHFADLTALVHWMAENIFPETHSPNVVQEFEVSTVAYAGATRDCVAEQMGGFSSSSSSTSTSSAASGAAFRPVPLMRPTPIFVQPCDQENIPPGAVLMHHVYPPRVQPLQAAKKHVKRSADSPEAPSLDYSKRVRIEAPETTTEDTIVIID